jgi:CRISPR-associated protein Csb2
VVTIALTFTAGRYSATPWGRHVNEGQVEWPPSPWRLLRALVAVWKNTLPDLPDEAAGALLAKLAAPPQFALPPAATTHTRHYMPLARDERGLIFDTSVAIDRRTPILVHWPGVELTADERALLDTLLRRLPYLGRAESWCVAELHDGQDSPTAINSYPVPDGREAGGDGEGSADTERVNTLTAASPLHLPDLLATTADLRRAGHDPRTPPGARWRRYTRPHACFPVPAVGRRPAAPEAITVARYRLDGSVLPTVFRTVDLAEALRRALMGLYGRQNGDGASPMLSGKAPDGTPLTGHRHASYLPMDEDADGRIDHLIIWAPGGLDEREREALGTLGTLRVDRELEVRLTLVYLGDEQAAHRSRLFGRSRAWVSLTPFMLPRHPKARKGGAPLVRPDGTHIDGPEDQIRREAMLRGLPAPRSIERLSHGQAGTRRLSWQEFRRWRARGGRPAETTGFGYVVTFEDEVGGPLALGYGSHFGLGLFGRQEGAMPGLEVYAAGD